MPTREQHRLVTQQAINVLTIREQANFQNKMMPTALVKHALVPVVHKFEHFANSMIHPGMGETISSYKKLMNNPTIAKVWQTAFGKDFGGMVQGDNKTGQKGTNAMLVMSHNEICHALRVGGKITFYVNPVVDCCT